MSGVAVLLCSGTGLDADAVVGAPVAVIDHLCTRPAAAAAALGELGASRVVLGLCNGRPNGDLIGALRRGGAVPFGIEAVTLSGRPRDEAARLVEAASAKLAALAPEERGRPVLAANGMSRRALFSFAGVVMQVPVAAVADAACVGIARCGLCFEACPVQAIGVAGALPSVDAAACNACGVCVPRCPHGALRLAGSATAQVEAQLEKLLPGVEGIIFACRKARADAPAGWALVELPTLGLVTSGWILQTRARGAQVRLAPCEGACCAGARDVDALAKRVLAACEEPHTAMPARLRLTEPLATADAVRHLAAAGVTAVIEDDTSPLGVIALDTERCTLCGACAAACPTSALLLDEAAQETVLRHEAAACVPCGRCVAACPEDALELRRGIDLAHLEAGTCDLARAALETCDRCGADLPPGPMRRRLREVLPTLAGAPLELCTRCASRAARPTSDSNRGSGRLRDRAATVEYDAAAPPRHSEPAARERRR